MRRPSPPCSAGRARSMRGYAGCQQEQLPCARSDAVVGWSAVRCCKPPGGVGGCLRALGARQLERSWARSVSNVGTGCRSSSSRSTSSSVSREGGGSQRVRSEAWQRMPGGSATLRRLRFASPCRPAAAHGGSGAASRAWLGRRRALPQSGRERHPPCRAAARRRTGLLARFLLYANSIKRFPSLYKLGRPLPR